MLLMEVIKELGNTLESVKDQIAACCIAEKNMQRLLDTVNESMSINDLHECYEVIFIICHAFILPLYPKFKPFPASADSQKFNWIRNGDVQRIAVFSWRK